MAGRGERRGAGLRPPQRHAPRRILFHGNNKTPAELAAALEAGVGAVVVDNLPECRRLASLARQLRKPAAALLRVNPGVEAHTHRYIVTAHLDSKFGISMARREELYAALAELGASDYLTFLGFHAHIGSQITDPAAFVAEIQQLAILSQEAEQRGYQVPVWDLGGGFAAGTPRRTIPRRWRRSAGRSWTPAPARRRSVPCP